MANNKTNNIEVTDELDDIINLRTANSKHYRNGNGSYSAVIFDSPVHYFDEKEKAYKEIDMSLEEDNTRILDGYKIKANKFGLKFARALSTQSLMVLEDSVGKIDISCGGYANRLTRLISNIGAIAKIDYADKKVSLKRKKQTANTIASSVIGAVSSVVETVKSTAQKRLEKCKKINSKIMYENAFSGTDLEYVLSPNKIKENIIIGARAEVYEYTFTMRLDGFDMQLSTDGSGINIISKSDNAVKYIIPAPFMYDANEVRSDSVMLKLDKISDGVFELTIVADKMWINASERAFPVVVDPQIISTETTDIIMKTYSDGVFVPSGDNLNTLGWHDNTLYDMEITIKTPNMVSKVFSNDTRVLNATIEFSKAYDTRKADSQGFNVYKEGRVIDHFTYNGFNNRVEINITNELNAAIKGKTESSVFEIKAIDRTSTDDDYMLILNANDPNPEFRPKIMIDYVSDRLSLGASYHKSDVKRAGVGEVNLFNGNLTFTHTDLSADGNNLPFDIKHIYMSKLKGKEYDCEMFGNSEKRLTPDFRMGNGWKMNIQQYLLKDEKEPEKATYLDGNGEVQLFEEKYFYEENGVRKFVEEEECTKNADGSFSITVNTDGIQSEKIVTKALLTESGLLLCLNANGTMIHLSENDSPVQISYNLVYHGYEENINVQKGKKCIFTRYFIEYPYENEYNGHHSVTYFHNFFSSKEVTINDQGKYCLISNNDVIVQKETKEYNVYNDNNRLYIVIPEPHYSYYYAGKREEMSGTPFYLTSDRKDDKVIFNTDEILTIYNELSELGEYCVQYEKEVDSIIEEENELRSALDSNIDVITNVEKKLKDGQKEYNRLLSELNREQIKQSTSLSAKEEKLAELNREYRELSQVYENVSLLESGSIAFFNHWDLIYDLKKYQDQGIDNIKDYLATRRNELNKEITKLSYEIETEKIKSEHDLQQMNEKLQSQKEKVDNMQEMKDKKDVENYIEKLSDKRENLNNKIEDINTRIKDLDNTIAYLIDTEKLKPIDYIIDESGDKLGFDFYGRLVEIADNNDNKTAIVYDGDNIDKIKTQDEKTIRFDYYLGRLNKIFDVRDRMTLFEYNYNGFLSKIVYPDNQAVSFDGNYDNRITEFKYNQFNELEEARDQSGYAVKYTYNYYQQVETVEEYTYTQEISSNSFVQAEAPIEGDSVRIQYNNFKSTSVKNNRGVATTYVFDNVGRAVNIYRDDQFVSQDCLNVTEAVNLSYSGRRKAYKVSVSQTAKNYVKNHGFESEQDDWAIIGVKNWTDKDDAATMFCSVDGTSYVGGSKALKIEGNPQQNRYAKQVVEAKDLPAGRNLIFSAWAKAQSAFIRSDRSSGYGDDIFENYNIDSFDDYKRNRKFGIRAVIKYEGFEPETMETTFDWYNTAWQYTALPIRLLKDRTLESITLYLDYSNNINSVLFDNVQLIEGEGEYKEFYEDGKLRYSTDGKIDNFYTDYYNGMPTHVISIDESGNKSVTEYSYDEYKRLVRSVDNDGIVTEYTYRSDGEISKTETYHKDDPGSKFVSETLYDDRGKKIGEFDPRGKVDGETLSSGCSYMDNTNLIKERFGAGNSTITYAYDHANDNNLSIAESDDGEDNKNLFEYKKGYLTKVYNDSVSFEYGYDGFGRSKFINMDGEQYAAFTHQNTADGGEVNTTALANGETIIVHTDKFGNAVQIQYAFSASIAPQTISNRVYDEDNRLTQVTDGLTGEVHTFEYDDRDRMTTEKFSRGGVQIVNGVVYDGKDQITKSSIQIGTEELSYTFAYSQAVESKLISSIMPNGAKSDYVYDKLGRVCDRVLSNSADNPVLHQSTYYVKYGDHATTMPSSERFGLGNNLDEQTKYKYDKNGNIVAIYKNSLLTTRYTYDKLNRMVREDNKSMGQTIVFNYDTNGNMLTKSVYAFTLDDVFDKTPIAVVPYSYRANKWRDQMTAYNGEKCEYDAIGNPTKYRNHITQFKYGGKLVSLDNNTYAYDANGERVSKTVNGVETKFITVSGKTIRSVTNGIITDFYYDSYGLSVIRYNGVDYFVRKNVLGDVTHIYDVNGVLQAQYVYDAWGNHKVLKADGTEDINPQSIGNINPIRYRGYYYDAETKLYYLKARYYDPETGRFISADDTQFLNPDTVNGLNLYAYCGNNPVMGYDPDGTMDWGGFWAFIAEAIASVAMIVVGVLLLPTGIGGILLGAGIGGAIGLASSAITQGISKGFSNIDWGQVAFNGAVGMFIGAIMGSPLGVIASGALIGTASFVESVGNDLFENNGDWNKVNWGKAVAVGVASGIISGIGKGIKIIGNAIKPTMYHKLVKVSAVIKSLTRFGSYISFLGSAIAAAGRTLIKGVVSLF